MKWMAYAGLLGALVACAQGGDSAATDSAVTDTAADTAAFSLDGVSAAAGHHALSGTPADSGTAQVRKVQTLSTDISEAARPEAVSTKNAVNVDEPAPTVCAVQKGEGCYWMENTSGAYCWVPWTDTTIDRCWQLDSCDGGAGLSGGGCYKWSDGSSGERHPWPEGIDSGKQHDSLHIEEMGC